MSKLNIYLVGGAVRDKQLGLPVRERDWVVVGATEQKMQEAGYQRVGKDFPVFLHPETHEEYALARTERKTGKGYYGFACHASPDVTLEEDLSRRDLTINAMAETEKGELIDPFHGLKDLKHKILRHVSPAFVEDPVRLLRVARFAARFAPLGFTVATDTLNLMRNMVQTGEVDELVSERVWKEMEIALKETDPTPFFTVLRACSALNRLWPSLDKLWGVPQPIQHHPEEDTGVHTMMALHQAAQRTKDPITRFAVVCHDLGKGVTPETEWPSHKGHEERGVPLINAFADRYRIPKEYRDLAVLVSRYHLHCHRVFELRAETLLTTLEHLDAFRQPERFEKFLIACEADAKGRKGLEEKLYPQAERMRQAAEIARKIKPAEITLSGVEIKKQLYADRLRAIQTAFYSGENL